MNQKISFLFVIFIILLVNAAGLILKYFETDNYIIILGFRFHLSLTLPFLLLIFKTEFTVVKGFFSKPGSLNLSALFTLILFSLLVVITVLYSVFDLQFSDPDYFYELGLSSIVDYPVYLAWNFPHLIFLLLFFLISSESKKMKFFYIFFTVILLFAYEFIPLQEEEFDFNNLALLISSSLLIATLLLKYSNIYLISLILYTVFWSNVLIFGSESIELTRILLASQYNKWEGFLSAKGEIVNYILPAHLFICFIILLFFRRRS